MGHAHGGVRAVDKKRQRTHDPPRRERERPLSGGHVNLSFRALSGRLKFKIRRHKSNKDSLPSNPAEKGTKIENTDHGERGTIGHNSPAEKTTFVRNDKA